MRLKIIFLALSLVVLSMGQMSCDDNGNAQQIDTEIEFAFSGTFVPAPSSTDTIDDGRPASLRTYEGVSGFGNTNLTILDEFAQPVSPVDCPIGNLQFEFVKGNFVIRVGNGDLLLGTIESGRSCFDPIARLSEVIEEGVITEGTGQFAGVTGPVEISTSSIFQNTTATDGYASGGSTGEFKGTLEID